jgi:predicted transcriptional regulator
MTRAASPISIRLDAETEQRLRRLARQSGGTLSSVVREAVAQYGAAREADDSHGERPYDRLEHLIGVVSRKADRSERTGERLRATLRARARARRAR